MGAVTHISNAKTFVMNALSRNMQYLMTNYFGSDTKHLRLYKDYGYPEQLVFSNFYQMWKRNGYARAGVNHAIETCWQEYPLLVEFEDTHDKTPVEKELGRQFERLQFWSKLSEADKYSRVGEYAGVIFRFRDGKRFDQPVDKLPAGLDTIFEIIPAWQGQLTVLERYDDELDENYGSPSMYQFQESAVVTDSQNIKARQFSVHPDRVHIWSKDSTVWGESVLEAGFNDLLTIQKVIGAGGEGFWKNAKNAPIMEVDPLQNMAKLAQMLGVPESEIADKMDEIVKDYNSGLDSTMMLQGIEAKFNNITLRDPDKFLLVAAQSFAASINEPLKLLVGNQNGERASTEDNKQWNKTCNSRRTNYIRPNIMRIIQRLVDFGVMPAKDWYLLWADLTESTTSEKVDISGKMATVNKQMEATGDQVFSVDEIREVAGWQAAKLPAIPRREKTKALPNLP